MLVLKLPRDQSALHQPFSLLLNNMPRLPLTDMIHRAIVYTLAGVTVYGGVMMVLVHRDTMQRGKGV